MKEKKITRRRFLKQSMLTAGVLAGTLIDLFSWRAAFIVPGTISLATGLILGWLILRGRIETVPAAIGAETSNKLCSGKCQITYSIQCLVAHEFIFKAEAFKIYNLAVVANHN